MHISASIVQSATSHKRIIISLFALLLSVPIYLPFLNNPPRPIWDEYYYLPAVQRHIEGTATYASHSPLGLMLMAAGAVLAGDNKTIETHSLAGLGKITDADVPFDYSFFGIRLPSALAGIIGSALFCAILLRLGLGGYTALAFSTLYIFENAFVIQFRAAQLDSFQIAFVLAGLLVWLWKAQNMLSWRDYALYGAFIGFAFCVKANAAVLMALPAFAVLRQAWLGRRESRSYVHGVLNSSAALGGFALAALVVFTLNFALSPHAPDAQTEAGRHDLENMGPAYRDYLTGRTGLTFSAWSEAITGYASRMNNDFGGVTKNDPNGQNPLTWPFYTKPISYRWDSDGTHTAYSTLVGNPIGWRLSFVGILGGLALIILRRRRFIGALGVPNLADDFAKLEALLVVYAVFMAVHTYLGLFRVMYVYHHFIGLIIGFITLALSYRILTACAPAVAKRENAVAASLSLAVALGFWFYSPFSYHRALAKADCELRNLAVHEFNCVGN